MRIELFTIVAISMVFICMTGCNQPIQQSFEDKNTIVDNVEMKDNTESTNMGFTTDESNEFDIIEDEKTSSELLDAFINGEINAEGMHEGKSSFSISDLENNDEEWLRYSVGKRVDADNDSEDELIMNGPYGGMILDARDGKVKLLTEGEGTAGQLMLAKYDDAFWVVHADTTHGGRELYVLDKYNNNGEIVESAILSAEYWDNPNDDYNENSTFSFMNNSITLKEFENLKSELFGWNTTTNETNSDDYVFMDSSKRLLTEEDLEGLTDEELRIGRNEIVARHGRRFSDKDLQEYFDSKSWYKGTVEADDFDRKVKLSDIENENMEFIKAHEGGDGSKIFQNGKYHIGGLYYGPYDMDDIIPPLYFTVTGDAIKISGTYRYVSGFDKDVSYGKECSDPIVLKLSPDIVCGHYEDDGWGNSEFYKSTKEDFFYYLKNGSTYLHLFVEDGVVIRAINSE